MGAINKKLHRFWGYVVEGKGFRKGLKELVLCIPRLWFRIWEEVDRAVGILAREILKRRTPIIKNKVFFHTQESTYCCNPKYICEELRGRESDIDIVWRVPANGKECGVPKDVRVARLNSFAYFKEIYSAHIIVTNSFLYLGAPIYLKKGQILIQTWHGSLGIKRFGKDDIKDSRRRIKALNRTGAMTDYCIINSELENHSLSDTFWPKTPKLLYGHPRNDLFFPSKKQVRDEISKELYAEWELDPETKILMYGPTFRDDKNFDCYGMDIERVLIALEHRFGGTWCCIERFHPSLRKIYEKRRRTDQTSTHRIIDGTKYLDMQELIAISDIAITDYSSWIFDFMLMRKPGFIFATDIEKYNTERGFYYPIETTPFPIARNNQELEANILSFDFECYCNRVEAFLEEKGCIEDGHASERVAALIQSIIDS